MKDEIKKLWSATRLLLWPEEYRLISLAHAQLSLAAHAVARAAPSFAALVLERDEVSLALPERVWQRFSAQFAHATIDGPYRVITFDLNIELSVSGYLLPAAERLAEAGISIVPQCAFMKDHLLIKAEDAARAMNRLQELIDQCKA